MNIWENSCTTPWYLVLALYVYAAETVILYVVLVGCPSAVLTTCRLPLTEIGSVVVQGTHATEAKIHDHVKEEYT